jgi:hypothetical protein
MSAATDAYRPGGPRLVSPSGDLNGPAPGGRLQSQAGGGEGGETEARLRVLETHVGYIREQLARIEATTNSVREDLPRLEISMKDGLSKLEVGAAELRVKVDHLPSKGFIISAVITTVTLILAVLGGLMAYLSKVGLLAQAIK